MIGWGAVGALLAVLAFVIVRLVVPESRAKMTSVAPASITRPSGLHLGIADVARDGKPLVWLLPDGSRLTFQPDTRWEPLSVSATDLVSSLRHGSTLFEVKPGGSRRWVIQAGPVSIEVIGTIFTVARDEKHVVVAVERGAVLVRGEPVPDTVQKLTAGQRIEIPLVGERGTGSVAVGERPEETKVSTPAWLDKAKRGQYGGAYDELGNAGLSAETVRAREPQRLLALADIARLSGHPADAVAPLERLIEAHPERPEAALAAVTLGRLLLDQLARPREGARALERALALGAPEGLRRDVRARLVDAYKLAGDLAAADNAARAYDAEFSSDQKSHESAEKRGNP
jgi:transmembrane sensor